MCHIERFECRAPLLPSCALLPATNECRSVCFRCSGIIGLPYALHESGFVCGVVLLVAIAGMTAYSVQLIVRLGLRVNQLDYERLCQVCTATSRSCSSE